MPPGTRAAVDALADALAAAGADVNATYLVGGVVRDILMGRDLVDMDVVVEGDGIAVASLLAASIDADVVKHDPFGTASVRAHQGRFAGISRVDIASARTEIYDRPGALPTVAPAALDRDLARRDFAINAMALPIAGGELIDPFAGHADLADRVIRVLHDTSFLDDPTRIIRAVRYAARYGFELDPHSADLALRAIALGALGTVSPARIWSELLLTLDEPNAAGALRRFDRLAAGEPVLGVQMDLSDERMGLVERLATWRQRLGAIVDVDDETFSEWARSLGMAARDVRAVVEHRIAIRTAVEVGARLEGATGGELASALGALHPDTLDVLEWCGDERTVAAIRRYHADVAHLRLDIDGNDLLRIGAERGPEVGELLDHLHRRRLEGEIVTRDAQLNAARLWLDRRALP